MTQTNVRLAQKNVNLIENNIPNDSESIKWFIDNSAEVKISEHEDNGLKILPDGLFAYNTNVQFIKIPIINAFLVKDNYITTRTIILKELDQYILWIPERLYEIINTSDYDSFVDINLMIAIDNERIYTRTNNICPILSNQYNVFTGLSDIVELDNNKKIDLFFEIKLNEEFTGTIFINDFSLILIRQ